jgi:hypothetical protein
LRQHHLGKGGNTRKLFEELAAAVRQRRKEK